MPKLAFHFYKGGLILLLLVHVIAFIEDRFNPLIDFLQRFLAPILCPRVFHRSVGSNLGSIDEQRVSFDQAKLRADMGALFKNVFQRIAIVSTETRDGFMVWFQSSSQPDKTEIVVSGALQFARTANTVGVAVDQ